MADTFVDDPYVMINAVDYSSKVRSVRLTGGREPVDRTAGGDGTRVALPGLRNWRLEVTFKEDLVDNGLDEALWALADAGTAVIIRVRPTQDAVGTGNPEWVTTNLAGDTATAGAIIDGPYDLVSGGIGALAEKTIAFIPGASQTKLTRTVAAI